MQAIPVPRCLVAVFGLTLCAACEKAPNDRADNPSSRLSLGFAVDTSAEAISRWAVDPARAALPAVVRAWDAYLTVRGDSTKRLPFWSAADRQRTPDPDLVLYSENYVSQGNAILVEALPVVAGDSSRWVLRTVYVGGGTAAHPGLLAMERVHVVHEAGRWVLAHPSSAETEGWRRERVGLIEYVAHPMLRFDAGRATETAQWVEDTAQRFGVSDLRPITYYLVPDLPAAFRVMGLDWGLTSDRVGGKANPRARMVFAADPRYGEAYRHELAHVLLHPITGGASAFVQEGIAYWLGGARGKPLPGVLHELADYLDQRPTIGLRAILTDDGSSAAASARFPAATAVFELAHRRGGDTGIRNFLTALGKEEPTVDSLARALGMAPAELESEWRALVRSYVNLTPGGMEPARATRSRADRG